MLETSGKLLLTVGLVEDVLTELHVEAETRPKVKSLDRLNLLSSIL